MSNIEELSDELSHYLSQIKDIVNDDTNLEVDELDQYDIDKLNDTIDNFKHKITLPYVKLVEDAIEPSYNYPSDSGFDLYSTVDMKITGFGRGLVPTGLKFDIPEGYEIQVRSKSGLAINQGLMVLNSPGTVDQGFVGEIKVILFNTNPQTVEIRKGQKIAQAVISPVVSGDWINLLQSKNINNKDRGENGFGSTGV